MPPGTRRRAAAAEAAAATADAHNARFEDLPDYAYLRRLLKDLFFREGYQYDFVFLAFCRMLNGNEMSSTRHSAEDVRRMAHHVKDIPCDTCFPSSMHGSYGWAAWVRRVARMFSWILQTGH